MQVAALEKLKETNPNGRFWIKLDATDLRPALQESVKGEWAGDCNLLDGSLETLRKEYETRRSFIKASTPDVQAMHKHFEEDVVLLKAMLAKAVKLYEEKVKPNASTSQNKLKELNWEKVELAALLKQAVELRDRFSDLTPGSQAAAQVHRGLEDDLYTYTRNLFKKKRRPAATHVLVIMLSDERRATKPYALPVQYVPYHSITDDDVRKLTKKIKEKMFEMDMTCVGTVTDGEFSTLRTSGENDEPTHTSQLVKEARMKVKKKSVKTLKKMIVKIGELDDGSPRTALPTPVPAAIISQLDELQQSMSWIEALSTICQQLVPDGYEYQTWNLHVDEGELEMLKSIIATFYYRATVDQLQEAGKDFNAHFYVPAEDPSTGFIHHEREDHNHVLKRIAKHLREGNIPGIDFRRFHEAMVDKKITEGQLLGYRKQSVGDAEHLLSFKVANYFRDKGYKEEEAFVRTVARWHEASDGRGLSQDERREANLDMLEFIKHHWIPWSDTQPGLKFLDINVRMDKICGFSRETILGITSNIESQELRRGLNPQFGPEHPRAGTTDDVECFFALFHTITRGIHTTLKDFRFWWQKLIMQFINRTDPNLPFYVWTLSDRYSLDEQPSFDEVPDREVDDEGNLATRLHRLRHRSRELSTIAFGRNTLPVQQSSSTRQSIFARPVPIPRVPASLETSTAEVVASTSDC